MNALPRLRADSSAARARNVYINGRFLAQRVGGVQRFAREVLQALDTELSEGECALAERNWILIVPRGTSPKVSLRRIAIRVSGGGRGHLWDQTSLFRSARDGILVNLTNGAPLLHPRCLVIIHDAAVFRTPENFTPLYGLVHRTLGRVLSRTSRLGTVSDFSKRELAAIFHLDRSRIFVVPNGCEHLQAVAPDVSVLQRLQLTPDRYFLLVGKPSPNKNIGAAMAAFSRLRRPDYKLVIVGMADAAVFRSGFDEVPDGVVVAGHLGDAQLVALFRAATALVFPSLYEGFGIPPLEGMVTGCPILAARIPAVLEVCGDAAVYFDPQDVDSVLGAMRSIVDAPALRRQMIGRGRERAKLYSWQLSARSLLDAVANIDAAECSASSRR